MDLASFSLSASRFRIPLATPAPSPPSSPKPLKPLPDIGIFRQSQIFPRLQIARWVVAQHLGVRAIRSLGLATGYIRRKDLPQFPLGVRKYNGRRSLGFFHWWTVFLRTRSTRCRVERLPARCGVGAPPCAKLRVPTCGFRS
jgi:hypothetical protein